MEMESLVLRARNRDEEAIAELYQATCTKAFYVAKSICRDESEAQDVLQDSYYKAFRDLDRLQNPAVFPAWVSRIVANQAKDRLKARKSVVLFSELETDSEAPLEFEDDRPAFRPDDWVDRNEVRRLVQEVLAALPEEQRVCMVLYYFNRMTTREIALELEISENTVKSRLKYGKQKMKTELEALEKKGVDFWGMLPVQLLSWGMELDSAATASANVGLLAEVLASVQNGAAAASGAASAAAAAGVKAAGLGLAGKIAVAAAITVGAAAIGGTAYLGATGQLFGNQPQVSYTQGQMESAPSALPSRPADSTPNPALQNIDRQRLMQVLAELPSFESPAELTENQWAVAAAKWVAPAIKQADAGRLLISTEKILEESGAGVTVSGDALDGLAALFPGIDLKQKLASGTAAARYEDGVFWCQPVEGTDSSGLEAEGWKAEKDGRIVFTFLCPAAEGGASGAVRTTLRPAENEFGCTVERLEREEEPRTPVLLPSQAEDVAWILNYTPDYEEGTTFREEEWADICYDLLYRAGYASFMGGNLIQRWEENGTNCDKPLVPYTADEKISGTSGGVYFDKDCLDEILKALNAPADVVERLPENNPKISLTGDKICIGIAQKLYHDHMEDLFWREVDGYVELTFTKHQVSGMPDNPDKWFHVQAKLIPADNEYSCVVQSLKSTEFIPEEPEGE